MLDSFLIPKAENIVTFTVDTRCRIGLGAARSPV